MEKKLLKIFLIKLKKNQKKYISTDQLISIIHTELLADFISGMTDRYAINLHKGINT